MECLLRACCRCCAFEYGTGRRTSVQLEHSEPVGNEQHATTTPEVVQEASETSVAIGAAQANNQLGWDLLTRLHESGSYKSSIIVSPLSVTLVMAMLAGGARDSALQGFRTKLGTNDLETVSSELAGTAASLDISKIHPSLVSANAIYVDESFKLHDKYIAYLTKFGARLEMVPTISGAVKEINAWIERSTQKHFSNMLSARAMLSAHMVIVNAVSFKGTWETPFDPKYTKKRFPFHSTRGKTRRVDMMFQHDVSVSVCRAEHYTAVRLPYTTSSPNEAMSLIAYLPTPDMNLSELLSAVRGSTSETFSLCKLSKLGLPKFKFGTKISLSEKLAALGFPIRDSFPEMSATSGEGNIVGPIIQEVFIDLDEQGTRAAAVTRTAFSLRMPPQPPPSIVFDRPFAFAIVLEKDANTLPTVLFTGMFTGA